jgi:predicted transposase/invertase (TIGR01784 family)
MSKVIINNRHDRRFKKVFDNPRFVEHLVKSFVDEDFVKDLDFSHIEDLNTTLIDGEYQERESDKIYRVKFKGKDIYIYLLLEFQSTVDKDMASRFLRYILEIIDKFKKDSKYYPAVFPILLYNGKKKWTANIKIQDMFGYFPTIEHTPRFQYYPILINEIPRNKLLKIRNVVSAIFIIENTSAREYNNLMDDLVQILHTALPEEMKTFAHWFNSILAEDNVRIDHLDSKLEGKTEPEETTLMFIDTLRQVRKEDFEAGVQTGITKGFTKGINKGMVKAAQKMKAIGMSAQAIKTCTGLSLKEIKNIN